MFGSQAHDHGLGIKPVSDVCFCDMTVKMSPTHYNDSKLDWKKDRHFNATSSLRLFILKNTFGLAENEKTMNSWIWENKAQNDDQKMVHSPLCDKLWPRLCFVKGPNWTQACPKRSQEIPRQFAAKTSKLAKAFDKKWSDRLQNSNGGTTFFEKHNLTTHVFFNMLRGRGGARRPQPSTSP